MSTNATSLPEKLATPNKTIYRNEVQLLTAKGDTVYMLSIML